jgi:SOS-response transcriptional repressor LexA
MDFYERVKELARTNKTTIEAVVKSTDLSLSSYNTLRMRGNLPRADDAAKIAQQLGTSVEYLIFGKENIMKSEYSGMMVRDSLGNEISLDGELCLLPILSQKAAAGHGQAMIENVEIVGELPFLKRMLRGAKPAGAKVIEVRGDSMTGVNLFDGDLVIFLPGEIRGDGIYVLRVGDELLVKRVEFDPISRKIRIMSENPRYPDRVESADGQSVEVVGKVYGWVHAHPY